MSETTHASDEVHGAHPRDAHVSAPGNAHVSAAGDSHAAAIHGIAALPAGGHGDHEPGVPLGPIDWAAWGAGLLGIAAGLVVAACLYFSTSL